MTRGPSKQFDPEVALSKATEVFKAKGYEAASLSELLHHMGISKKSLYDTYGNKRSLFLKALEYYGQTTVRSIRDQLSEPGSPLANLEGLFQDLQVEHGRPGSHGCMLGTNIADFNTDDAEMSKVLRGHLKQLEEIYYRAVKEAQVSGELDSSFNPRDLSRLLLCIHQGMVLVGRVLDTETLLKSVVETTTSILESS